MPRPAKKAVSRLRLGYHDPYPNPEPATEALPCETEIDFSFVARAPKEKSVAVSQGTEARTGSGNAETNEKRKEK